jgi:acetyltransferase-like isoleucine patch superfamily enzyme
VTIREKAVIGNNVSIGTLSDIQGNCKIGNYVRLHSNVGIGQLSLIDDFVWIFPCVVLTNDPTPPSENFVGVHVHSFAIVATGSIIMPGLDLGQDCLIGAGAIVTKSIEPYAVAVGNPAKTISDVRMIKNKITGEPVYPWREHFGNYMPWDGIGFDAWYESLNLEDKSKFTLDNIVD